MEQSKRDKVLDETKRIIETIEKKEEVSLPIYQAEIVKDEDFISDYLGNKVIGFYFYARLRGKHYIRSIFDGCDYKINKDTLEKYNNKSA